MTERELISAERDYRARRAAIMDAASNCWDVDQLERLGKQLRELASGHPYAKIHWPHRALNDAAAVFEQQASSLKKVTIT